MQTIQKLRAACLAGLALSITPAVTLAQEPVATETPTRFAVGLEGGTAGIGPAVIVTINPKFTATVGYTWFDFDYDVESDRGEYSGDLNFSNLQAMINWHPWGSSFHVSGGVFFSDNSLDITAKPKAGYVYDVGNNSYSGSQISSINGTADLGKSVAPFIGVGWSKLPEKRGWGVFSTLGILISGSAEVRLTATGPQAGNPTFQNDLRQEEREINDDLDDLKTFPVAQVGVLYRF